MLKSKLLLIIIAAVFLSACNTQEINTNIEDESNIEQYSCSDSNSTGDQYSCSDNNENSSNKEEDLEVLESKASNIKKAQGGLSPEDALTYMKNTKNLVIIDTRDLDVKPNGFTGSIEIPYHQIIERFSEIPKGRPILLHCGGGNVAPKAYKALLESNPEIPELGYIEGAPLFDEYNLWIENNETEN